MGAINPFFVGKPIESFRDIFNIPETRTAEIVLPNTPPKGPQLYRFEPDPNLESKWIVGMRVITPTLAYGDQPSATPAGRRLYWPRAAYLSVQDKEYGYITDLALDSIVGNNLSTNLMSARSFFPFKMDLQKSGIKIFGYGTGTDLTTPPAPDPLLPTLSGQIQRAVLFELLVLPASVQSVTLEELRREANAAARRQQPPALTEAQKAARTRATL